MIVDAFDLVNDEMTEAIYRINDVGWVMVVFFLFFNLGYLILIPI